MRIVREVVDRNVTAWRHEHTSNPEPLWGRIAVDLAMKPEQVQKAERDALGSRNYTEKFTLNLEGVIKGETRDTKAIERPDSRLVRNWSSNVQSIER